MNRSTLLIFCCVFVLFQANGLAQKQPSADTSSNSTASRDPQALALLAQCAGAMGVPGPVFDVYAEGQLVSTDARDPARTLVIKSKGADRVRYETSSTDRQETYVVNRGRGHELRAGMREPLPAHTTGYHRPEHIPALACQIDIARPNMSIRYVGLETIGAQPVHHIKFTATPRGNAFDPLEEVTSEFHVFLDAQSLVVIKTQTWVFAPDAIENRSLWEVYYGDYRVVGGVLMPFRLTRFAGGRKHDDITFSAVRLDAAIADSEFE